MGVKQLWSLLAPVGRPVLLDTIEGTTMAIDSSIWIYQFQATMRDKDGRALVNAHVLGFLRRISKLLFYGIRPVFVFDGGAPALKSATITERKRKKAGAADNHAKLAEKLLAAHMRREAIAHVQNPNHPQYVPRHISQTQPTPTPIDENTVYLEDLEANVLPNKSPDSTHKRAKFHDHDPYRLPDLDPAALSQPTPAHAPDPRLATEDELRAFIDATRPDDFDVAAPAFRALPTEVQYEIIGDLRLKSRQTSHRRLQSMLRAAPTPLDFSKAQIRNLQQRNALTQQLLETTDSIGKAHVSIPVRIASERNKEYVLVKNHAEDGGWVLGIRDDGTQAKPIVIDDAGPHDSGSESDMDEVVIPAPAAPDPDLREYHGRMALASVAKRSAPASTSKAPLFIEDVELDVAIQESLLQHEEDALQQALAASRADSAPDTAASRLDDDDDDDLYVPAASRLDTALAFANTTPSKRAASTSMFGSPTLLLSHKSAAGDVLSEYVSDMEPSAPLGGDVFPAPPMPSPQRSLGSDDDMEEIAPSVQTSATPAPAASPEALSYPDIPLPNVREASPGPARPPPDDEEFFSDWDGSSSPVPAATEDWDAAQEMDVVAEEGDFAQFVSQMKGQDLDAARRDIDAEIRGLNKQKKAAMRDSDDITQQMISQIKLMLRLFGIPYITAPMEAEAQCAALVSLGLVEGIITDDSDVFLFGGLRVFKNMFNQSKTVECFLLRDLARELGLERDKLVRLAYLLGSDYVGGLPGVGPVVAMELMKEFPGEDGLHRFKEWWRKVQSGKDSAADTRSKFRKRFKKRFKDLYLPDEWPNPAVRDAYYHPTVDESEEPFKWGLPDLDALRQFFREELGWHQAKVDDLLLPIIRKMGQRGQAAAANRQGTLDGYFDVSLGGGAYAPRRRQAYSSKRLQQVVADFRAEQLESGGSGDGDSSSEEDSPLKKRKGKEPPAKRKAGGKAQRGARKRKQAAAPESDVFKSGEVPSLPLAAKLRPRPKPTFND